MKSQDKQVRLPRLTNVRRRVLPLASAAAAMGLVGCATGGGTGQAKLAPDAGGSQAVAPESEAAQQTAERVRALTQGLDAAIEKIDKEKLQAITQTAQPVAQRAKVKTITGVPSTLIEEEPRARGPLQLHLPGTGPLLSMSVVETAGILGIADANALDGIVPPFAVAPGGEVTFAAEPMNLSELTEPAAVGGVQPTLEEAMDVVRARVAARPSLHTVLALALLDHAEGRSTENAGKELSITDQKLLGDLLGALQGMNGSATTLNDRAGPLLEAAKKWQAEADLVLPKLALASRVDSYGVYTKLEPKFTAGKKHNVIIYCEVANFVPKKTDEGWFETRLSQQETLATDDGLLLWRPNAEDVEDRSKNQRRDFYLVKKLTIPDNIPVGKYALRMSVTDRNSGKIAVVTLPIEIVK